MCSSFTAAFQPQNRKIRVSVASVRGVFFCFFSEISRPSCKQPARCPAACCSLSGALNQDSRREASVVNEARRLTAILGPTPQPDSSSIRNTTWLKNVPSGGLAAENTGKHRTDGQTNGARRPGCYRRTTTTELCPSEPERSN